MVRTYIIDEDYKIKRRNYDIIQSITKYHRMKRVNLKKSIFWCQEAMSTSDVSIVAGITVYYTVGIYYVNTAML